MSFDCAAEEIADELLFKTGKAILSGDFESFCACFGFPHVVETSDSRHVIEDMAGLRVTYDALRAYMRENEVVDLVRTVVEAHFIDSDTIESTHVASMTHADGIPRRNPYPVYSVIRRHDPLDWKIMSCLYVILDCDVHNAILAAGRSSKVSQ